MNKKELGVSSLKFIIISNTDACSVTGNAKTCSNWVSNVAIA